jgi:hypothetical protein
MIAGQSPRLTWRPNPEGVRRTVGEAVEIARSAGVKIPDDVEFFVDEDNELDAETTARGPKITKAYDQHVKWYYDLAHIDTKKVPFLIRQDIFASDEAIIAVIAHELYELENMRVELQGKGIISQYFIGHTCPGNPGNLHDEAWDYADALIERLRSQEDTK